jgi:hypothetical protein
MEKQNISYWYEETYPNLFRDLSTTIKNWDEHNQENWILGSLEKLEENIGANPSEDYCPEFEIRSSDTISGRPEIIYYSDSKPLDYEKEL